MQALEALSGGHSTCINIEILWVCEKFLPARDLVQQRRGGLAEHGGRGSTGRGCAGNAPGQHPCKGARCHRCL